MIDIQEKPGMLVVRMRSVVPPDEAAALCAHGSEYLDEHAEVDAVLLDIRGCKPIGTPACDCLREFFASARRHGIHRFYRIGNDNLCAVQMRALERDAAISEEVRVVEDEDAIGAADLPGVAPEKNAPPHSH